MKAFLIANIVYASLALICSVGVLVLKKDWNHLELPIASYVLRAVVAVFWIIWASALL